MILKWRLGNLEEVLTTLVLWDTVVCVHNVEWNCVFPVLFSFFVAKLNEASQTIVMKNVIVFLTSIDCVSKKQPFIAIINNCCVNFIFIYSIAHFSPICQDQKIQRTAWLSTLELNTDHTLPTCFSILPSGQTTSTTWCKLLSIRNASLLWQTSRTHCFIIFCDIYFLSHSFLCVCNFHL